MHRDVNGASNILLFGISRALEFFLKKKGTYFCPIPFIIFNISKKKVSLQSHLIPTMMVIML